MARPFWQSFMEWDRHPWNQRTFDPLLSYVKDGRDITIGGQIANYDYSPEALAKRRQNVDSFQYGYPQAFKRSEWEKPVPRRDPVVEPKDDDDWFKKMMQYSFMQSMMPAREGYSGTSKVVAGPKQRAFFDIPYYGSPYPGGTNV